MYNKIIKRKEVTTMARTIKMTRSRKTEAFINYKYNDDDFYGYDLSIHEESFVNEKRFYADDRDVMEEREYEPINADGIMFGSELEPWEKW